MARYLEAETAQGEIPMERKAEYLAKLRRFHRKNDMLLKNRLILEEEAVPEELANALTNQVPMKGGQQQRPTQPRQHQQRGARNFLTALNIAALLLGCLFLFTHLLPNTPTSLPSKAPLDRIPAVNMSSTEQT
jgi:hypothetical protein